MFSLRRQNGEDLGLHGWGWSRESALPRAAWPARPSDGICKQPNFAVCLLALGERELASVDSAELVAGFEQLIMIGSQTSEVKSAWM